VQDNGKAIRYGIGVGRSGFTWSGVKTVSQKREWPDWTPPPEMLKRRPDLPTWMAGGVDNPLGARAIYLGSTLYRIHGSNEPWTIGPAVQAASA
jgi:lipoprotein-anchoring transpeptidase ErfK/SrfK